MEKVHVGRRRYSDPDVLSLIRATGELVDPRSSVINQARQLNLECDDFSDPLKRLAILASFRGYRLKEMDRTRSRTEPRDAVVVPTDGNGCRGMILYNPTRPAGRVAFSIAHEIAHTFFPNSVTGARFRSICAPGSREARELEALCDLGASEVLMPIEDFRRLTGGKMGLDLVDEAAEAFGSSYEATVFRFATAYEGMAAAGLLRFRLRLAEQRSAERERAQAKLFTDKSTVKENDPQPKYRRQSYFVSESFDADEHIVRWNKSFDVESCVYEAGVQDSIVRSRETLPTAAGLSGNIEAIRAPYQRDEADSEYADVLFLWWR